MGSPVQFSPALEYLGSVFSVCSSGIGWVPAPPDDQPYTTEIARTFQARQPASGLGPRRPFRSYFAGVDAGENEQNLGQGK